MVCSCFFSMGTSSNQLKIYHRYDDVCGVSVCLAMLLLVQFGSGILIFFAGMVGIIWGDGYRPFITKPL